MNVLGVILFSFEDILLSVIELSSSKMLFWVCEKPLEEDKSRPAK